MHVSNNWKYVCGRRLYACINRQKFKCLDLREITSLRKVKKHYLHGKSFKSSWKINLHIKKHYLTKTNNMVNTVEFLSDHMPEQTHMVCFKFLLHLEFAFNLC